MLASALRRAVRPSMAKYENWFSKGFLNRTSYFRQDIEFLTKSCKADDARFVILDGASNPLVKSEGKIALKEAIKTKSEGSLLLATISWKDIASYYPKEGIFAAEPTREAADRPLLVFLGIDERGVESAAPDSSTSTNEHSSKVQKSLPEKREGAAYPEGIPYFVVDTTHHPELAKHAIELAGGDEAALFMDLRAELLCLDFESTGIAAEARALVDWNKRTKFCAGCGRPTGAVWAGWKRACLPDTESQTGVEKPPCVSKKGVHNFSYPRTDPVVIMAVQSHDKKKLLLGRQKSWPKGFFSCLAGFIEPGESIEEAVKREVWEEAGVHVDSVHYHSSQPWPFPGSLMLGLMATAAPDPEVRTDLDNELEIADFYSYEIVKAAVDRAGQTGLSRAEVAQIQKASDTAEESAKKEAEKSDADSIAKNLRIPPKTAIAHTLIRAWVDQVEAEGRANL